KLQIAYKKFGQRVLATFRVGSFLCKTRDDFLRLGSPDEAKKTDLECKHLGKEIKFYFDHLELMIKQQQEPWTLETLESLFDATRKKSSVPMTAVQSSKAAQEEMWRKAEERKRKAAQAEAEARAERAKREEMEAPARKEAERARQEAMKREMERE